MLPITNVSTGFPKHHAIFFFNMIQEIFNFVLRIHFLEEEI